MFCPKCRTQLADNSYNCTSCDWTLQKNEQESKEVDKKNNNTLLKKCHNCGQVNQDDTNFCMRCGAFMADAEMVLSDTSKKMSANNIKNITSAKKITNSKRNIIITIIIAVILISFIIGVVIYSDSQKNETEFNSEQIYNEYTEINEEALYIEEKYTTDGFIQPEDISTVLDELEVLAKEYKSKGLISSYDKQSTSIYFKLNSGIGYLYTPTVEELLAGDDIGKILTIEPYATSSEFVSNYLIGGKSPDKAAEKIVANLPDNYSFSKEDNWDSFSLEQVEQLGNHKIIIWYGHGGYVKEYGSVLGTSIPIKDQSSLLLYQLELSNGEMILGKDCFCVSPFYFEKHLEDNSLENSLVFLGACQSAMDNRLAEVFINKGASLVVGNSQTIRIRYMLYMMDDFMSALTNQYDDGTYWTAEDALAYAKSQNGDSDSEFWAYGAEVKLIYPENESRYRLYSNDDSDFELVPSETITKEENNDSSDKTSNIFEKEETTTDPYNGLPAPVELKLVNSNGKKAMKNDTSYEMDYSMHLIEDYHGLKYLVLTCSATSKYSDRKANGPDFFPVTITKSNMERTFDLDDEVKQAYDEIIFSGYLDTTLYPGEVVKDSYIYDFYGDKENITVVLKPSLHGNVVSGSNNYIHGIYTGNYSFSENKWNEYIFLEFAF